MFLRRPTILILILSSLSSSASPQPAQTLAVVNFINRSAPDDWDWLEKGLADLLTTDMARSDKLVVVERERMQAMLHEMKLSRTGLADEGTAQRVGKALAVDRVLAGSFRVTGEAIEIEAHIVAVATGKLVRVEAVKGSAADVLHLEKEIALSLLDELEVPPGEAELRAIERLATDDLDAARHHYRALDFLDRGSFFPSLQEVLAARRRDPGFVKSMFLAGTLFESLGGDEHALVEFTRLLGRHEDESLEIRGTVRAIDLLRQRPREYGRAFALCDRLSSGYAGRRTYVGAEPLPKSSEDEGWDQRRKRSLAEEPPEEVLVEDLAGYLRAHLRYTAGEFEAALNEIAPVRHTFRRALGEYWTGHLFVKAAFASFRQRMKVPRPPEGILWLSPARPNVTFHFGRQDWRKHAVTFQQKRFPREDKENERPRDDRVSAILLVAAAEGHEFESVEIRAHTTQGRCQIWNPWRKLDGPSCLGRFRPRPEQRLFVAYVTCRERDLSQAGSLSIGASFRPASDLARIAFPRVHPRHRLEVDSTSFKARGRVTALVAAGEHVLRFHDAAQSRPQRKRVSVAAGETLEIHLPPVEQHVVRHPLEGDSYILHTFDGTQRFYSAAAAGFNDGRVLYVAHIVSPGTRHTEQLYAARRTQDGAWEKLRLLPPGINYPGRNAWPSLVAADGEAVLFFESGRSGESAVYAARSSDLERWSRAVRCRGFGEYVPSVARFKDGFLAAIVDREEGRIVILESEDLSDWTTLSAVSLTSLLKELTYKYVSTAVIGASGEDELILLVSVAGWQTWKTVGGFRAYLPHVLILRSPDGSNWSKPVETQRALDSSERRGSVYGSAPVNGKPASITSVPGGEALALVMVDQGAGSLWHGNLFEMLNGPNMRRLTTRYSSRHSRLPTALACAGGDCFYFVIDWGANELLARKLPPPALIRRTQQYVQTDYDIRRQIRSGDLDRARELLADMKSAKDAEYETKSRVPFLKALVAEKEGNLSEALNHINAYMKLCADDASIDRARILLKQGRSRAAVREFTEVERASSLRDPTNALLLANVLAETGDLKGACDELYKILQVNPNRGDAMRRLAVVSYYAGNTDYALKWLDCAIYLSDTWMAHFLKALLLHDTRPEDADTLLQDVRRRMEGLTHWYVGVADLLLTGQSPPPLPVKLTREQIKAINVGAASPPDRDHVTCQQHFWQGVRARWDGDPTRARTHFEKVREYDKLDWWPYVAAKLELARMETE